jgi:bifunctional non-homologous end joining protein LigD
MIEKILGIEISNPNKIIFPKSKITKFDLVSYYSKISNHILPYLKNRPLVLERYPNGINQESFFQKNTPKYYPKWIETVSVGKLEDGITRYIVCQNKKTLIYLANLATITMHVWLSNIKDLKKPDRLIFDLDPSPEVNFKSVVEIAFRLKDILTNIGLRPYVMTTGSKGLHISMAIKQEMNFRQVQTFAYSCAYIIYTQIPDLITLEMSKAKRIGKIFIDTLRNQFGSLAVAPYSVRAKENASVATPIFWQELTNKNFSSKEYNISNIFQKLKSSEDPWSDFLSDKQSLVKPHKKLIELLKQKFNKREI